MKKIKKTKSVYDLNEEAREKHGTLYNRYSNFPVGTRVKIICIAQDFNFFNGDETGEVVENKGRYLGVIVRFDFPRHFENGYTQYTFNFEPKDLVKIKEEKKTEINLQGENMLTLWDAFLENYNQEIRDWTLRETLEAFWHYCQGRNKSVCEWQNKRAL